MNMHFKDNRSSTCKRVLVFPCGSEIGLEIHRSVRYSRDFEMIGASSADDHGRFVFENYIGGLPYCDDANFISVLKDFIRKEGIDAVYPTMDAVAEILKKYEEELGALVIGSSSEANSICASKILTYRRLYESIPCPVWVEEVGEVKKFPVFIKPDRGYGAKNTKFAKELDDALSFTKNQKSTQFIFCEYLPGREYTVDCFSDGKGQLRFHCARERARVSNGISVRTQEAKHHLDIFSQVAMDINKVIKPRGAWFFQMKENNIGIPKLLEVATRLGGGSAYCRSKGINFALLTLYDAFGKNVEIDYNRYAIEMDRALNNRYKIDIKYSEVYIDFDDCLVIRDRLNSEMIAFLYKAMGEGKRLILLTRHAGDIYKSLSLYRLAGLFDQIIHITDGSPKSTFITGHQESIFIDDSFSERREVATSRRIPVFSPDMIEVLL